MKDTVATITGLSPSRARGYRYAALVVALCTLTGLPLRATIDIVNLGMVYLVGVVAIAARFGLGASITTALLSVVSFNFFFTRPYYSLNVDDPSYYITFFIMMLAGLITASLAARLKEQALFFHLQQQRTDRFYSLTRALASTRGHTAMAGIACMHIKKLLNCDALILLPDDKEELAVQPGYTPLEDMKEMAIARWCFEYKQPTGMGTATMASSVALCLPLIVNEDCLGVLSLKSGNRAFNREELSLLETLGSLIASALQRANAAAAAEAAKIDVESERLRNMLLSSVSHDLRTPLASISGSIEALIGSETFTEDGAEVMQAAFQQTKRLTRMVNNLLDINRLESGAAPLHKEAYYLQEVIGAAITRASDWLTGHGLQTHVPANLPLMNIDGFLIEQVLSNLLDNAVKYTPPGAIISLSAETRQQKILITIADNGCGVPSGKEQKIFEKFYRASPRRVADHPNTQGSGLGLAICKAIIAAHGGEIWAENNASGGMTVYFTLPLDADMQRQEIEMEAEIEAEVRNQHD